MDNAIPTKTDGGARIALLAGLAVAVGALRGLPTVPLLGVPAERLIVPLLLAGAALFLGLTLVTQFLAALGGQRILVILVVILVAADALWATIAVAWSASRGMGLAEAARSWLTSGSVLIFATLLRDRNRMRWLCAPVLVAGCVVGILAIAAAVASHWGVRSPFVETASHSEVHGWARATGVFGTPATFGAMMLGLAGTALLLRAKNLLGERSWRACMVVAVLGGVASASIPGVGCVALLVWVVVGRRNRRAGVTLVAAWLIVATVVIYSHLHAIQLGQWHWDRPSEMGYEPLGRTVHPLHTVGLGPLAIQLHGTGYARIHATHLRVVAAHPFGVGTASFARIDTGPVLRTNGRWARQGHPHAWVLMRGSEGGVIGFLLAAGLVGLAAFLICRVVLAKSDKDFHLQSVSLVVGLFLWASWFGDFLHRWDVALLVGGIVAARSFPPVASRVAPPVRGV